MTDKQISKTLNFCSARECSKCPRINNDIPDENYCRRELCRIASDFIDYQKAEIDKLKEELADARYLNTVAESDGIKEFADGLKAIITINNTDEGYLDYSIDYNCLIEDIDALVKEMTEGKNE